MTHRPESSWAFKLVSAHIDEIGEQMNQDTCMKCGKDPAPIKAGDGYLCEECVKQGYKEAWIKNEQKA